jgi:drug/metabolite transporter (DMT)-like permease
MSPKVRAILRRYATNRGGLGDNFDPLGLTNELRLLSDRLQRIYWMTAIMIIVVYCLLIVVGAIYFREPAVLAGIAAAVGVTVWGAVDRMSRLAREMAETNLLVLVSASLSPESLDRLVQKLLEKSKQ